MFEKPGSCLDAAGMKALMSAYASITLMAVAMPPSVKRLASRIQFVAGYYPDLKEENINQTFATTDPGKFTIVRDMAWVGAALPALCSVLDKIVEHADHMNSR